MYISVRLFVFMCICIYEYMHAYVCASISCSLNGRNEMHRKEMHQKCTHIYIYKGFIWLMTLLRKKIWNSSHPMKCIGEKCIRNAQDDLNSRFFSARESLTIWIICGKRCLKIRHSMVLRHPVATHWHLQKGCVCVCACVGEKARENERENERERER